MNKEIAYFVINKENEIEEAIFYSSYCAILKLKNLKVNPISQYLISFIMLS